jgi:GH15 family glucan-1,4-alpha-glucosidase
MDAICHADSRGLGMAQGGWMSLARITDWLCEHWDQPEEGIWETRGGRKDFTYGRFQCWVALDRMIRLTGRRGRPGNVGRWMAERDKLYHQIMSRGWNPQKGTFTQHYGSEVLDASLLLMPLMGFVSPTDPMWLSTLDAMDRELVSDSLVYRYNPSASPDGLLGHEGTFSLCTFFYADALARSGRLTDAELTFQKMHTYANHLGLYSEEVGLTGEQLGNFPQAAPGACRPRRDCDRASRRRERDRPTCRRRVRHEPRPIGDTSGAECACPYDADHRLAAPL